MPTILELFKGKEKDNAVKADTETRIEQETSGIRIRSAVEVNNPIIYGNEATRIALRSTPVVEDMRSATGGTEGDGGLIGKGLGKLTGGKINSISDVRNKVNTVLGIPQTQIPTRLIGDISKLPSGEPITKDSVGKGLQGNGLGEFLKESGGGDPKTLGKQVLGNGIGKVKDKLRSKLFGEQQTIGDVIGEKVETNYTNTNSYSKVLKDNRNYDFNYNGGGIPADTFSENEIDLTKVSPIHGVKRKGDDFGRFGNTSYGYKNRENPGSAQSLYSPEVVDGKMNNTYSFERTDTLEVKRGMFGKRGDKIILNPNSYDAIDKSTGKVKIGGDEYVDLVPLWIGYYGNSKPTLFRGTITGLTETVSPSWSSNNFVGNPYKFYTYESIERSTSFNISLYCNSALELAANWERVSALTKMAYPSIKDNLANPPFISFKLGDIYTNKTGIIESLTYTMPDNGPWETEVDGFILPKFIDVAITIKFIENVGDGTLSKLYNYGKSKEAVNSANEEAKAFSDDSRRNSDGTIGEGQAPIKINKTGNDITKPSADTSGINSLLGNKNSNTKTPKSDTSSNPVLAQSAAADAFDGKTSTEKIKELESKQNLTPAQSNVVANLLLEGYTEYTGGAIKIYRMSDSGLVMYSKDAGFGQVNVIRISSNGNVVGPYRDTIT